MSCHRATLAAIKSELTPAVSETDQNRGRSTFYYCSRSRSPPVHSEAVYLGGLLASGPPQAFGGAGPCTDDPRLAVPEDHRALERLISHGFGRSRTAVPNGLTSIGASVPPRVIGSGGRDLQVGVDAV